MNTTKSTVVIARLLGNEGFTPYVANQIQTYWKKRSGLTERQQKSIKALRKEFSSIMKNLDKKETLVIGKYIGLLEKMCFETGLKIGLQTFAESVEKDVELPFNKHET